MKPCALNKQLLLSQRFGQLLCNLARCSVIKSYCSVGNRWQFGLPPFPPTLSPSLCLFFHPLLLISKQNNGYTALLNRARQLNRVLFTAAREHCARLSHILLTATTASSGSDCVRKVESCSLAAPGQRSQFTCTLTTRSQLNPVKNNGN